MSGYGPQEKPASHLPYEPSGQRVLSFCEADMLLAQALANPRGGAAVFLAGAIAEGWRVDFLSHDRQILGYDELVGTAQLQMTEQNPVLQSYGQLILHSINPNFIASDDGK